LKGEWAFCPIGVYSCHIPCLKGLNRGIILLYGTNVEQRAGTE
jgi:hypothetical protein